MTQTPTQQYEKSGVSIAAGEALVDKIRAGNPHIGGFAGLYKLDETRSLVACTDGVGTKLELGIALERYEDLGQDLVAMSVNDLIVCGARPLFFLDYFATGKLEVGVAYRVIQGIQRACQDSGLLLLGGETAEMPGFYDSGKFDLAGFAVGEVENSKIINGSTIVEGDVIVGLPSSGFHANGYSLVRHIIKEKNLSLDMPLAGTNTTLGMALTEPTCLYVRDVQKALQTAPIKGMAHITGGGLTNIKRVLPQGLTYQVDRASIPCPPVVAEIKRQGNVTDDEAYTVWNMGLGYVCVVAPGDVQALLAALPKAFVAGRIRLDI